MKCPSCATQLDDSARFCGVCGHRLDEPLRPKPRSAVPAAGRPAEKKLQVRPGTAPGDLPQDMFGSSSEDPYIGTMLNNRFKIEAKLGEGGFGAVYRGTQSGTGRKVALKLLHPEMTRDSNLLARFRREGLVLCNLTDAHTITTYDFDQTEDGTLYIAMELLEGKSLHDIFQDEAPIEWRRMLKIISQMCTSLAEAHSQGVVHRDLKPENIHLENRPGNPEFVKILDFGIAKVMQGDGQDKNSPQLTATGQTLGTLEYMSPEQLMGKPLDGRSDVYALGVLTYELVTGRLPFPDAKGPAGLITAQLREVPDPPSHANPSGQIPDAVDRCVLKMLEKDKNKRYPDVDALRVEIEEFMRGGAVAAPHSDMGSQPNPIPMSVPSPATDQPSAPVVIPQLQPSQLQPPQAQPSGPQPQFRHNGLSDVYGPDTKAAMQAAKGSLLWLWLVLGILAVGGGVGALLALR